MTPSNPFPGNKPNRPAGLDEVELPALGWMRRAGAEEELLSAIGHRMRQRRRVRLRALAASLAVVAAASIFWHSAIRPDRPGAELSGQASTFSLPQRRSLPDGSVVELRENAQISVNFRPEQRRVFLTKGEAHFQVAKDKARPFVVAVAGVEVRAVGTAFAIELGNKEVAVLVTEGRVALDQPRSAATAAGAIADGAKAGLTTSHTVAVVDSGYRAIVEVAPQQPSAPKVSAVSEAEIKSRLAWRIPQLEFSHTPLPEVISIVNQHNSVRLVIASAKLNDIKLSGFLRADNTAGLVRLLESNFGVKSERSGNSEIRLLEAGADRH